MVIRLTSVARRIWPPWGAPAAPDARTVAAGPDTCLGTSGRPGQAGDASAQTGKIHYARGAEHPRSGGRAGGRPEDYRMLTHGPKGTYVNHGCRCPACAQAQMAANAARIRR